ncbi:ABC transporter permease [Streptococcus equinus]|uniref:ABC transporter permease n=1 Tax=Streptococcus equinus TaxID=1335 RepID=UPI00106F3E01|nr:ABC transporter permease [Streptococcus equinus]TFH44961.1 ABC transporter permease [Streptococcus equinus]
MFSKLLKYELKSVGKWYFALNASIIAMSFFLGFSIKSLTNFAEEHSNISSNNFAQLIPIILALIFGVLVASACIATVVIIVRRFYKNLFGREGYLTLTLPVSTHQIILSKLVASAIWTAFNLLIVLIGIAILILPISGLGHFLAILPQIGKMLTLKDWFLLLLLEIISVLSGILMIYLAISIGQLFANKRGLMAFIAYCVLSIILIIVSELTSGQLSDDALSWNLLPLSIIENLIEGIIFYLATHYLLKNKINIQ